MGNVPISCCRSKSPGLQRSLSNGGNSGIDGRYSPNNHRITRDVKLPSKTKLGDDQDTTHHSHNLQHISEREPDDVETDPSSNPLNRPIFATRSSCNKNKFNNYSDSYSSNNSIIRRQTFTPLMSSRDHGYNSTTSTNLTQNDCPLIDSFDSTNPQKSITAGTQDKIRFKCENSLFSDIATPPCSLVVSSSTCIVNFASNASGRRLLQKSSSCSTIFIDGSTISQPDLNQTIKCVSLAVYYHIKNRTSDNSAEIFDEHIHPLKMPVSTNDTLQDDLIQMSQDDHGTLDEPNLKTIYSFVKTLFMAALLTSEYAITTLVYLERLMTYSEMDLTPRTWRRMFLGAILLSSKVWEDQAVWNVDYAQILEEISVEDINELERQFLEMIQFNMNVPSSVYAKYYFHLRTLALKNGLSQECHILTVSQARTLEAMSNNHIGEWYSSPIQRKSNPAVKRHNSFERLSLDRQVRAVLM